MLGLNLVFQSGRGAMIDEMYSVEYTESKNFCKEFLPCRQPFA